MYRVAMLARRAASSEAKVKGAELKQYMSEKPHVVLGIQPGDSKKKAKVAYYTLAMRFHPDNADTGDNEIMERINVAYNKYSEDGGEARVEFEEIRTAGMSAEEKTARKTGSYTYQSPDEEARKWRAREDARKEAKERLLKRKKAYHTGYQARRNLRPEQQAMHSPQASATRAYERADGSWIYHIRGEVWTAPHWIEPFFMNYRLVRASYSPEEFRKMGLTKIGGQEDLWGTMAEDKEEIAHIRRTIPLLYTDGNERDDRVHGEPSAPVKYLREVWRSKLTVEYLLVASVVGYTVYSWGSHLLVAYQRGGLQYAYSEQAAALACVREARERRDVDADVEKLSAQLEASARHLEQLSGQARAEVAAPAAAASEA
eukprot:TRINITY_DN6364_c0_g1_i1.p1 TRINITY_DN6364_c0_g1~~TRINITY_DN6364_c0_g1_i1.p1  ORF type:complete len:373 (+),score=128.94 TRINITY_DN6364_c0_g1_i1:132-1250(+)